MELSRRKFLAGAALAATAQFATTHLYGADAAGVSTPARAATLKARRRLGSLEVSAMGLGVQNMTRTYQTTIPSRPEMIRIIREAFEHGLTFYDAAEAYGPWAVEQLLGEAVVPFRDQVVLATKFGWNMR